MSLKVGHIVEGVVTGITNFGAFVLLPNGVTGLVHISEVAHTYVKDVNDYLKKDDVVKVKVLSTAEGGKVALSIKQAKEKKEVPSRKPDHSFEDKLSRFLKESDERQQDIKRSNDPRRGHRSYRHHS
ncbi:MAG: S1 RNA-binding domain-containing protein [Firmicutes bacterium]|jgi:S1 RNA binding domain protein|nr:S1 RNA-binding domain-containing protein [Bacillota bacterium]